MKIVKEYTKAGRPIYKEDGKRFASVTSITPFIGQKGALMWWHNQQGLMGIDTSDKSAGEAIIIGKLAHAAVEADIKGQDFDLAQLDRLSDKERECVTRCIVNWKEWRDMNKLEMTHSELSLVDAELGYGGTLDIAAIAYNRRSIIDIKTGSGPHAEHWIQVRAYGELWNKLNPKEPIEEYHIIRLGKEDAGWVHAKQSAHDPKIESAWMLFKCAMTVKENWKILEK